MQPIIQTIKNAQMSDIWITLKTFTFNDTNFRDPNKWTNIGEISPHLLLTMTQALNMQANRCYIPPKQHHNTLIQ